MNSFPSVETEVPSTEILEHWKRNLSSPCLGLGTEVTRNSFQLLVDGGEFLERLVQLIDSAQETLSFQFLNMEDDAGGRPVADALIRAAKRRVRVKGILEWVSQTLETNGELTLAPWKRYRPPVWRELRATRRMLREMKAAGVEMKIPFPWFSNGFTRNHRKSIVADHRVLFVGGFNPTEHNRIWHEVCAVIQGPAALQAENFSNQVLSECGLSPLPIETGAPTGHGPGHPEVRVGLAINEPRKGISIRDHFVAAADLARNSIRVENAYFADPACFDALVRAARRGVRVQLIVARSTNHRSVDRARDRLLPALTAAGGEVYFYRRMTHAKLFLADDVFLSLGSANFTPLNIRMERELNVVALDDNGELGREVKRRVFETDIENSDRLQLHI